MQSARTVSLTDLYERALLIRRAEEAVVDQYAEQNRLLVEKKPLTHAIKCPTHMSIGQEAAAAAIGFALTPDDVIFSTHRCHGHYLGKGGNLRAMMAELFGKETGCSRGKGGSMHLVDGAMGMLGSSAIVAGSVPLAVGAALSFQLRGLANVAMPCLGDGAVEQGLFTEALNFSALRKLPVVFLVENNFYATLSHVESRQTVPIPDRGRLFGMPSVCVEGSNLMKVYEAMQELVQYARSGRGPALLEVQAYRWLSHVGTEPDTGRMRRTADELRAWQAKCPIDAAERELRDRGAGEIVESVKARVSRDIAEALVFAKESEPPMVRAMFEDLHAESQR